MYLIVLTKMFTNNVGSSKLRRILGTITLSTNGCWRKKFQESISMKELFSIAVLWHSEFLVALCSYVCTTLKITGSEFILC